MRAIAIPKFSQRFEARLAIEAVLERWPDLELVTEHPVKDPRRQDRYLELKVRHKPD